MYAALCLEFCDEIARGACTGNSIHRQASTLLPTWLEPFTQVRTTATTVFATRPRATVLPISAFFAWPMKMKTAVFGVAP